MYKRQTQAREAIEAGQTPADAFQDAGFDPLLPLTLRSTDSERLGDDLRELAVIYEQRAEKAARSGSLAWQMLFFWIMFITGFLVIHNGISIIMHMLQGIHY